MDEDGATQIRCFMPGARLERTPYSSMRVASSKVTGDVDMTAVKGGVIRCAARLDLRT
jgi:hypothetical protein